MSFVEILERISEKVSFEVERKDARTSGNITFNTKLSYAIELWCSELEISKDITNYIFWGCRLEPVKELTELIWHEAIQENKTLKISIGIGELPTPLIIKNHFYQYINHFFNKMNVRSGNMRLIVTIAFGVTAVGYWLYKTNHQKQIQQTKQPTLRQEPRQNEYTSHHSSSLVRTITKQFLVLVASASQADFLESLEAKRSIDINDAEKLYKVTKYLWLGSESSFNQKKANLKNYLVITGESEYDIKLVYLELKQSEAGFKSNTNQLDRYDAFRKLPDLVVDFTISDRLQMEAYENFEVYNR
ncbi:hypothetical protein C7Y66_25015 [Chroococcidiopsis sp. CCALA 051]|uniref:hypothetical protein n=1 Tax=Chroococcidiopsis sp. CCALA 051 TaxID=869949 RepID=UPI000D0DFB02|nr:hypothetical protein [Chroococcidiopsis sp. CCALA 051]MBE9019841.1 hypothetical protein [Chroococcidiopsidales cyanobacterium LEGE 13417]PSM46431.1 hypothetical protein C7Y66_25015 [Chroococcidiopsis sp. CCALA 051]